MGDSFTSGQALDLLLFSEGLMSAVGTGIGHTLSRHVRLSNEQIMDRLRYEGRNGEISWFSAFEGDRQASEAAADALNAVSKRLQQIRNQRLLKFSDHVDTTRYFPARFAFAAGVLRLNSNRMNIVVHKAPPGLRYPYMVLTLYACPPEQIIPVTP